MPNYVPLNLRNQDDQPREKFLAHGSHILSDVELISILLRTGSRDQSAVDLARSISQLASNNLNQLAQFSVDELCTIPGVGPTKAITVLAALSLSTRMAHDQRHKKTIITSSKDVYSYLSHKLTHRQQEAFWALFLKQSNEVISDECISLGGISQTAVDPKIIFSKALYKRASALIVCHNHPSGNLTPSTADKRLTEKLIEAGRVLDIKVLDHIIFSPAGYLSMADEAML